MIAGPVFWAAEDTAEVLRFYRDFVANAPDELGNIVRLGTVPRCQRFRRICIGDQPSPWLRVTPVPSRRASGR